MAEDAEASWGVAESRSCLGGGEPLNEEGAESLVLSVSGVGRLEEEARHGSYIVSYIYRHRLTISYL
jgi:hypothetical protein